MNRVKDKGFVENFLKRDGRLNRWRYFKRSMLIAFITLIILFGIIIVDINVLGQLSSFRNISIKILFIVIQIPIFCLTVRRLHDMNKGEMLAYIYITIELLTLIFMGNDFLVTEPSLLEDILDVVSFLIALHVCLCPGTRGKNKYGEDPLA